MIRYLLTTPASIDPGEVARLDDGSEWVVLDTFPSGGYVVEGAYWPDRKRERVAVRDFTLTALG